MDIREPPIIIMFLYVMITTLEERRNVYIVVEAKLKQLLLFLFTQMHALLSIF